MFIRHLVRGCAVQMDAAGRRKGRAARRGWAQSWKERRWIDYPAAYGVSDADTQSARPPTARLRLTPPDATRSLPEAKAALQSHRLRGGARRCRSRSPSIDPWLDAAIDWERTIAFRRHLWSLGLGVAEAMDTAQRGMGIDWPTSLELIRKQPRRRAGNFRARSSRPALVPITSSLLPKQRSTT